MVSSVPEQMHVRRRSVHSRTLDTTDMDPEVAAQSFEVMEALGEWQETGRVLAKLSARYMGLNETDMRAIRMIMAAQQRGEIVTPKDIASAVGISAASTTKLVDRLAAAGHVTRSAHPSDRRTQAITVTDATRLAAGQTIGQQHARRFAVAAAMTAEERETVIFFLRALVIADTPQTALLEGGGDARRL